MVDWRTCTDGDVVVVVVAVAAPPGPAGLPVGSLDTAPPGPSGRDGPLGGPLAVMTAWTVGARGPVQASQGAEGAL